MFYYVLQVCKALIVIGALNWGLVGFFGFDLVEAIFGRKSVLSRVVYALVGLAALVHVLAYLAWKLRLYGA